MDRKVLIAAPVHEVLLHELQAQGYAWELREDITQGVAREIIQDYEGIITSTRLQLDCDLLDRAIRLRWIGRMGSGMEVIDLDCAAEKGIYCFSSPEGNANAVAEQALGMLLGLQHKINHAHAEMQQGIWLREENRGMEIEGATAAIIGYGHNGSALAGKMKCMGLKVLALDKYKQGFGTEGTKECRNLEEIWEEADIISFHLPLTQETYHYFDDHFLENMRTEFVLLNLSRGPVVSMNTLYKGMKSGKIKAAALDVWEQEPVQKMEGRDAALFRELINMPNFIGTPHIAGYTHQALFKMSNTLASKIRAFERPQGTLEM